MIFKTNYGKDWYQYSNRQFATTGHDRRHRPGHYPISGLENVLNLTDKDIIHPKIKELNELLRPYAERVMDMAVGKAMNGKKISDSL